jgi:NAD(P)-dependent dehydrogenase (short-subunit alcohol dehydrogenase family)
MQIRVSFALVTGANRGIGAFVESLLEGGSRRINAARHFRSPRCEPAGAII